MLKVIRALNWEILLFIIFLSQVWWCLSHCWNVILHSLSLLLLQLKSFDTYKAVLPLNIMRARHYVCVVSSQTFLLLLSLNAYCVTLTPLRQILRHVTAWDLLLSESLSSFTNTCWQLTMVHSELWKATDVCPVWSVLWLWWYQP